MFQKTKSVDEIKAIIEPIRNINIQQREGMSIGNKVALWIVSKVGTFGFFIFTIILTMIPVAFPATMTVIMFISSSLLQLVLLPLIMIGQNLQSAHSEARADEDFEINKKAELEVETILKHLENQNEMIANQNQMMLDILKKLEDVENSNK